LTRNYRTSKKRQLKCILFLLIFIIEINLFIYLTYARKEDISGNSTEDEIKPGEYVSYTFENNVKFKISTNTFLKLKIEYDKKIENRETSFEITNNNSIFLEIISKQKMRNYGFTKEPKDPTKGNSKWIYKYNCIYKVKSNTSIEKIIIRYKKNSDYGLDLNKNYSIVLYESDSESWEMLSTKEASDDSEIYLETQLSNIQADKEYYITIYEREDFLNFWFWFIIIVIISFISVIIILTKKEYIQFLKKRSIPINKGAHRLTLEEVLENKNRNKIIDLILKEPGIHFNELLRKTSLAPGNLLWHLEILETYKIIGKKVIGKYVAYIPFYQKNPVSNIDLKLSKSKLTLEILKMIENEPGIWNSVITKKKKVDHKTIRYHIQKLIDLGLVISKKEGRKRKFYPNLESDYFNKK